MVLYALVALFATAHATRPSTALGDFGMVSATNELATEAGVSILEAGGSVFDAAVAIQLVLAVVEFEHVSLLGGGGLVYKAPGEDVLHIDFREEAPALFHPKTFCKNSTCLLNPDCGCEDGAWGYDERCTGGQPAGVPGVPAMILRLAEDGLLRLPLKELAKAAIHFAEEGFVMYDMIHATISAKASLIARDDAASEAFLNANRTAPKANVGEVFKQPLLAQTLREFFTSIEGLRSVYTSPFADEIVAAARNGVNPVTGKYGLITKTDLEGYRAVRREPVVFTHTDMDTGLSYTLSGATMPFSGPTTMRLMLEQYRRLQSRSQDPMRRWGYFLDAQNAGFADRNAYLADADFVDVPLASLLSDKYAQQRFDELFGNTSHNGALEVPVAAGRPVGADTRRGISTGQDHGTSHMSIADSGGAVLAMTTTVNGLMGSMVAVPRRGVILNNQLCDFDAVGIDSSGAMTMNAPEGGKRLRRTAIGIDKDTIGGKRPRSSMTQTIVEAGARAPFATLAIGAPGGADIIGGVTNVLRHIFEPGFIPEMLQEMTDLPRMIGKNSGTNQGMAESALGNQTENMAKLKAWGYKLTFTADPPYYVGETFSRVESAMIKHVGSAGPRFAGAADSLRFPPAKSMAPTKSDIPVTVWL